MKKIYNSILDLPVMRYLVLIELNNKWEGIHEIFDTSDSA